MSTTLIVSASERELSYRKLTKQEWIERHASGTLRKNAALGFNHHEQYIHERVCWEFGDVFVLVPSSRVMYGEPITEGDCKPVTEAGWYIERFITKMKSICPDDEFKAVYANIASPEGATEGIGILCRQTSAQWVTPNRTLIGIVTEYDVVNKCYKSASNPG